MNAMQPIDAKPHPTSLTASFHCSQKGAFVFVIFIYIKPFSKYTSNNCKTGKKKQLHTNLITFLPLFKLELVEIPNIKNLVEFCSKGIKDCRNYFLV